MTILEADLLASVTGGKRSSSNNPARLTRDASGCPALTAANNDKAKDWLHGRNPGNFTTADGQYPAIFAYEYKNNTMSRDGGHCAPGADD
jgi:hypothetical protein